MNANTGGMFLPCIWQPVMSYYRWWYLKAKGGWGGGLGRKAGKEVTTLRIGFASICRVRAVQLQLQRKKIAVTARRAMSPAVKWIKPSSRATSSRFESRHHREETRNH